MLQLDEGIRNYYEQLLSDYLFVEGYHQQFDIDFLSDLSCLVLNELPPKYIRFEVDVAFFLSSDERLNMHKKIAETVQAMIPYLQQRETRKERDAV